MPIQLPKLGLDLQVHQGRDADRDALVVVLVGALLLLVFNYWGRPVFYLHSSLVDWVAVNGGGILREHPGLGAFLYWGGSALLVLTLVPAAVIRWLLRHRPRDYGYRLRGIARHFPVYGLLYLLVLPVLVWASGLEPFLEYYPIYDRAAEGGAAFWVFQAGYALQFVGAEAFFRGFLTFGLARRFGALGIPLMVVPYMMIHFEKPAPEAFGAIFAGLVLGYLALRSKSFVPGVMLHVAVALTMDLLVLWRLGALANVL